MSITVLYARVGCLRRKVIYDAAYSDVSDHRKEKISRLKFAKDRRLSLGAGVLLTEAARRIGIVGLDETYGERGKPYIAGRPDFRFSLSHSGDTAICAVSDREIGCDIEKIAWAKTRVAERYFSDEEKKYLASSADDEKDAAFFRIWTLKESCIKAAGEGFAIPLNSFSVVRDGAVSDAVDLAGRIWTVKTCDLVEGYSSALCFENAGDTPEIVTEEIDISAYYC